MQIGQFIDLVERQQRKEDAAGTGRVIRQLPLVLETFGQEGQLPTSSVLYFYADRVVLAESRNAAEATPLSEKDA